MSRGITIGLGTNVRLLADSGAMSAVGQERTSPVTEPMSALPPKADIERHEWHVRFVPKADITRCSKIYFYSITSSASASSLSGIWSSSDLAVLRLIASSNLVDCTTGSSAGLAPLRMRPVYRPSW